MENKGQLYRKTGVFQALLTSLTFSSLIVVDDCHYGKCSITPIVNICQSRTGLRNLLLEAWTLSQDGILGIESESHSPPPTENPDLITASIPLLTSFLHRAHALVRLILSHLDTHLHLPQDTLATLQALDKPSGTSLRLLRYLPQPAEERRTSPVGHTDIGTVTVLFNILGGLQVLPPACDYAETSWLYVKPEPGCPLISMGDAMVEWSGGLLRSDLHRVLYAPGKTSGKHKI